MELREFVKDTLIAITLGVQDAQADENGQDAVFGNGDGIAYKERIVSFDVALAESDSSSKSGKIGVALSIIGEIGAGADQMKKIQSTTRVQFEVPVRFPGKRSSKTAAISAREFGA